MTQTSTKFLKLLSSQAMISMPIFKIN